VAIAEGDLLKNKNNFNEEYILALETELNLVLEELSPLLESETKEKFENTNTHELFAELELLLKENNADCLRLLDDICGLHGADDLVYHIENYNFKQALLSLKKLREDGK
jgi:hypothetical protein